MNSALQAQARPLAAENGKALLPGFCWAWRFTWDSVHVKATARKPFLVVDTDKLKLPAKKHVKITK